MFCYLCLIATNVYLYIVYIYFQGTYVLKGYDLTNLGSSTISGLKSFFYGTYKLHIYFVDKKNKVQGCITYVIQLNRPWE